MTAWLPILSAGALVFGPLWRPVRMVITFLHELGHVVAALLCGGRPRGLHLDWDTSGLTEWERQMTPGLLGRLGHRFVIAFVAAAGYPAAALTGLTLAVTADSGDRAVRTAFVCLALAATASLVLARSWRTRVIVAVFAAAAGVGVFRPVAEALTAFALLACFGGVRASLELWRRRPRRGDRTDPGKMAEALLLPAGLWAAGFIVVNLAASAATVGLVLGRLVLPWHAV